MYIDTSCAGGQSQEEETQEGLERRVPNVGSRSWDDSTVCVCIYNICIRIYFESRPLGEVGAGGKHGPTRFSAMTAFMMPVMPQLLIIKFLYHQLGTTASFA